MKDGGPAFPSMTEVEKWNEEKGRYYTEMMPTGGMTLRDYFAAKAMQGLLACPIEGAVGTPMNLAKDCYTYADAFLKARETQGT